MSAYAPAGRNYGGHSGRNHRPEGGQRGDIRGEGYGGGRSAGVRAQGGRYRNGSDSREAGGRERERDGGYYGDGGHYRSRSAARYANLPGGRSGGGYGGSHGASKRCRPEAYEESLSDSREDGAGEPGEAAPAAASGKPARQHRAVPHGVKTAANAATRGGVPPMVPSGASAAGASASIPQGIPLSVSGCRNKTISDIIAGTYLPFSSNHGKVVYKREEKSRGLDVLIYFWDDRDGPELCGWWFGPNVGGDQVWAYHPSRTAATPPASEWNVPHDGPIDYTLSVTANRRPVADEPVRKQSRASPVPARAAPSSVSALDAVGSGPSATPCARSDGTGDAGGAKHRSKGARGEGEEADSRSASPCGPPAKTPRPSTAAPQASQPSNSAASRTGPAGNAAQPAPTSSLGMNVNQYFATAYSKRLERLAQAQQESRGKEQAAEQPQRPKGDEGRSDTTAQREAEKEERTVPPRDPPRRADDRSDRGHQLGDGAVEASTEVAAAESRQRQEPPPARSRSGRHEEQPRQRERDRDRERESERKREEVPPARHEAPDPQPPREEPTSRQRKASTEGEPTSSRTGARRSRSPVKDKDRAGAGVAVRGTDRDRGSERDRERDRDRGDHKRERGGERMRDRERGAGGWSDRGGEQATSASGRNRNHDTEDRRRREEEPRRRRDEDDDRRRRDEDRRKQEEEERRRKEEDRRKQEEEERRRREDERRRQEAESSRRWEAERGKREEEKQRVEDERRRHEEAVQRRRDEKRKVEEAEKARVEEQRRKERDAERKEEEQRRAEEDKRREELEKKRREEWRRHEEQTKAKAEEDKKRAEEDAARRRGEEAKVLRQQQATLSVLRLLQKLSNANPENFDTLKAELEQALRTELPETGSQEELLKAEADRVLEYAKQYVEQVREQQQKWEEMRLQQLQKMEEQERTARALVEELEQLVTLAEAASEFVHYTAAPLAGDNELENAKVLLIGREVEQAGKTAMTACSACADFLVQKRPEIEEAENIRTEVQAQVAALQTRIQSATQQSTEALQRARESRERIAREVASSARNEQQTTLFQKYDEDGDGVLSRQEILKYAKEEFGFDLPKENLDRICRQLFQSGRNGLEFADLQVLKTAVGIAREEERSREKRLAREEREQQQKEEAAKRQALVDEKLEMLSTESVQLMSEMTELEAKIQSTEQDAERLVAEVGRQELEEVKSKASAVDASVEVVMAALQVVQKQIQGLSHEVAEMPELVDPMRQELTSLSSKADMQNLRLMKAQGNASNARQMALHKAFTDYDALRLEVATKLRVCIEAKGGKVDDLFGTIAGDDRNEITLGEISVFLKRQQCEIEAEKLEALFPGSASPDPSPEAQAPTASQAKAEKAEVQAEPAGEAADEVTASAGANGATDDLEMKDLGESASAQLKVEGQSGSGETVASGGELGEAEGAGGGAEEKEREKETEKAVVEPGGSSASRKGPPISREDFSRVIRIFYKVVKEIVLSDDLLIERSGQIRRMDVSEVMEVFQGPVLDPSVGVCRIHGRAMKDGVVGWVTVAGKQGVTFLLPGGNVFKVLKPTFLSEEMKDIEGERFLRKLHEGEMLEVLDWTRTSRSALGVTRIKAKVLSDGSVGWATTIDNDGVVYLEAA